MNDLHYQDCCTSSTEVLSKKLYEVYYNEYNTLNIFLCGFIFILFSWFKNGYLCLRVFIFSHLTGKKM